MVWEGTFITSHILFISPPDIPVKPIILIEFDFEKLIALIIFLLFPLVLIGINKSFEVPKASSSLKKNPAFAMEAFEYKQEEDSYICPAKKTLKTNGRQYNKKLLNGRKSYKVKHYKTTAC